MTTDTQLSILAQHILRVVHQIPYNSDVFQGIWSSNNPLAEVDILTAYTKCGSIYINQIKYSLYLSKDKQTAWFIIT